MKVAGRKDAAPDAGTRPAAPASGIRVPSTDAGRAFERITFDDLARAQFLVDARMLDAAPLRAGEHRFAAMLVAAGDLAICERCDCDILVLPGERFCTRHAT